MIYPRCILVFIFLFFLQFFTSGQIIQKIDSLKLLLEVTKDPEDKIEILINLIKEFENNDLDKALDYAQKAYNLSEETDNDEGKINSMLLLGEIHNKRFNNIIAIDFAIKAKELAEELKMIKETAEANLLMAQIFKSSYKLREFEIIIFYVDFRIIIFI